MEGTSGTSVAMTEEEMSSAFSNEDVDADASSGDETLQDSHNSSGGGTTRKRKREKHQRTSCELCKARKVKCDRAEPACSWCARHNRTCVYLERQKPGSRIGFTLELETKVNRIDALLQALGRRVEEHIANDHSPAGHPTAQTTTVDSLSPPALLSSPASASVPPPSVGHGAASSSYHAQTPVLQGGGGGGGGSGDQVVLQPDDRASVQTLLTLSVGVNKPSSLRTTTPSTSGIIHHPTPSPGGPGISYSPLSAAGNLPPHDVVYTLVDLYFKHCNTWCPILDRKTTFGVFFGSTYLAEADRVLLHAIVATTMRFLRNEDEASDDGGSQPQKQQRQRQSQQQQRGQQRLSPEMRTHFHAVSRRTVQLYAMEHVSVPALRALVILCLDEIGTENGPRARNLVALLAQGVRHLGLGEESSVFLEPRDVNGEGDGSGGYARAGGSRGFAAGRPESWIEDEGRRRLCWMVYLIDRYTTVSGVSGVMSADYILDDDEMRRVLPCSYDLFSRNVPVETRSLEPREVGGRAGRRTVGGQGSGVSGPSRASSPPSSSPTSSPYAIDTPENLGSFSYHCEIMTILSRVHTFLRTPVDPTSAADMARWRGTYRSLDGALDGWLQSLPGEYGRISALCHSDPASRVANWFVLHSAYVAAAVRLHSAAAYPPPPPRSGSAAAARAATTTTTTTTTAATPAMAAFAPSHYAMQRCLSAVQSLGDIAREMLEAEGLDLLGPPFALSLWVAARLLVVHAAATGCSVDPKIDFFVETLSRVGRHWEVATGYARVLGRVVGRARAGEAGLGAMRESAYALMATASSTRRSGLEQTSSQATSLSELDSIQVFDFFNYPKLVHTAAEQQPSIPATHTSPLSNGGGGGAVRQQEVQHSPYFGGHQPQRQHVPAGGGGGGSGRMPNPDTDWLGFRV